MIVTTTPTVEGYNISQYLRVISGDTIVGINIGKDFMAGISNIFGGRVEGYETEARQARENALAELVDWAQQLGADAVVGVDIDYEAMGQGNMLMVVATGTAVKLQQA